MDTEQPDFTNSELEDEAKIDNSCVHCGQTVIGRKRKGAMCNSCAVSRAANSLRAKMTKQFKNDFPVTTANKPSHLFDWTVQLDSMPPTLSAAPVDCFKHCPFADSWTAISIGMKIEVPNREMGMLPTGMPKAYWVAKILKVAGYFAQVQYLGVEGMASVHWAHLCSPHVHPVGWCSANGQILVPPPGAVPPQGNWSDYLMDQLRGSTTLLCTFYDLHLMAKYFGVSVEHRFPKDTLLEVLDKNYVSRMKLARVIEVVGDRLHVAYEPSSSGGGKKATAVESFWCNYQSPIIHYVGWSAFVGHDASGVAGTEAYKSTSLAKVRGKLPYAANESTPDMFARPVHCDGRERQPKYAKPPVEEGSSSTIVAGMKLEAIDPLQLSQITVATVMSVLGNGYIMINVDGIGDANARENWFCFHVSSPCLFPVGFCEALGLELRPPTGYKREKFVWGDYLFEQRATAVPGHLLGSHARNVNNPFKVGMKLEAVDLIEPQYICAATVVQVVGWLIRISFDGWNADFDQYIDCESPDIYPIGWCQLHGHEVSCGKWPPDDAANDNGDSSAVEISDSKKKTKKRRR